MTSSGQHTQILGVLFLVCYGFGALSAMIFLFIEDGWFLLTVSWVFGAAGMLTGIGLLLGKRWSRPLGAAVSLPVLLLFPFGTALNVYAFWVLPRSGVQSYLETRRE